MTTTARISGTAGGAGSFVVPSISNPGAEWIVDWLSPELRHCFCIPFNRAHDCRHVREVAAAVRDEYRSALSTPESRGLAALKLRVLEEVFER